MKRLLLTIALFAAPAVALAHGFGARIDLPLPLNLYLLGAGAVVAVSFVLIGFIGHRGKHLDDYPRYDLFKIGWIKKIGTSSLFFTLIKAIFVALLLVIVVAGFIGRQSSVWNIAPTFVWILFGVGLVYISSFIGNIWPLINPWKTIYEWLEKFSRGGLSLGNPWPERWGTWPALVGFFAYRWIENIYPDAAVPSSLAILIVFYSAVTFAGMIYFGKENWLRFGDPFSVFFRFLSRFSITEARAVEGKKELNLRPPAVGLFKDHEKTDVSTMTFVLFMLSSVAFDGVKVTPFWLTISGFLYNAGLSGVAANTIGLVLLLGIFVSVYLAFSALMRWFSRKEESVLGFARKFAFSLLPIAIVYEVAHFVTLLFIDGQRAISLVSDPFGFGWDLFGTADYGINYQLINLKSLWNWQVGLIVLGHIAAVYVAHLIAVHFFKEKRVALRSQYPMILLMVGYTMLGLWILAQPIVVGVD